MRERVEFMLCDTRKAFCEHFYGGKTRLSVEMSVYPSGLADSKRNRNKRKNESAATQLLRAFIQFEHFKYGSAQIIV